MTAVLIAFGGIFIKITQDTTWLSAFFHSISARTAGFATENIGMYSNASLFVIIILMFIGASPGSTGGGIKTTTFFVMLRNMRSVALNKECVAFKRHIGKEIISKSLVIMILASICVVMSTLLIVAIQPELEFEKVLFEVVSAFATVGLSAGVTTELVFPCKIIIIITMFIGRLGPLTILTLWWNKRNEVARYSEEDLIVG